MEAELKFSNTSYANEELSCKNAYRPSDMLRICNIYFLQCLGIKPTLGPEQMLFYCILLYISPIEILKVNNLDIVISLRGLFSKINLIGNE